MAKVLQNFLIGVGLDTERYDKGAKNVEGSLSRMRTLVGFTGAAISGAFGLAGTAALNAGKRVLDFNNAAEKLKTPTDYVWNYGRALAALGGNAEDALTSINAAENALTQFELKGEFAPFNEAALAGVRDELNALMSSPDGGELLRGLSGVVPRLDKYQQRLIKDAFSLSDTVMILLNSGTEAFDASIARAGELYGEFGRATDEAREFARAVAEINTRFQGIGETLAEKMLPGFTGIIDSVGDLIDQNRDFISKGASVLGENPGATALAAGGGVAAATGAGLRMIGLRSSGVALSRLGIPGMVIGGGLIAIDALSQVGVDEGVAGTSSVQGAMTEYMAAPVDENVEYGINPAADYTPPVSVQQKAANIYIPGIRYEAPVYEGYEINNAEAASANPDVIMVQSQREQADKPLTTPRINVENHLEVQMEMDGRAIDTRVIDVIERRERDTIDDIYSSVDR